MFKSMTDLIGYGKGGREEQREEDVKKAHQGPLERPENTRPMRSDGAVHDVSPDGIPPVSYREGKRKYF